jgi:hypothetical protein
MSVKDNPPVGASNAKCDEEMLKLGNESLDFSNHDIVPETLPNKHQDSILEMSFAIDDVYTAGRESSVGESLADAAEAFKKSIEEEDLEEDPPIEEAEEAESSVESSFTTR